MTSILLLLIGFRSARVVQAKDQIPAGRSLIDSTAGQNDIQLMADSLTAAYAGRESPQEGNAPAGRGFTGQVGFERTLVPLTQAGDNIFQSVLDDPNILNAIRRLKREPAWDPFQPGMTGAIPYDYHYDLDGATKNSQTVRLFTERIETPAQRAGFRLDGRYEDIWGPFPNQHTARLEALLRFSLRIAPSHTATLRFLGRDNGWHINRGNTVFTDRARYMLEGLNTWRARTGGIETSLDGQFTSALSYRFHARVLSIQWASDPPDPSRVVQIARGDTVSTVVEESAPPLSQQFLEDLFPVTMATVFAARRNARTLNFGAEAVLRMNAAHQITVGGGVQLHRFDQMQQWQTPAVIDGFNLRIQPREFNLFFNDRLRFWALVMGLGLDFSLYDPGAALWRDVYRTLGDDRAVQDEVRQLLISSGGDSQQTRLLSPHISIAYPSGTLNAHMTFSVASQTPTFEAMYADDAASPYADRQVTQVRPQRFTTLEAGFGIGRKKYSADITVFYRDAERYVSVYGPDVLPQSLSNYASYWGRIDRGLLGQHGIETSLVRRSAPVGASRARLSGRISYLYLFDPGPVRETALSLGPGNPLRPGDLTTFDRRLNDFWNRRHWIALTGALRLPSGVTLTAVGHFQSGAPYRAPDTGGIDRILPQDYHGPVRFGPWMRRFDGRIDVPVHPGVSRPTVILSVEARNITDNKSIDVIPDPFTFEKDGQPDNPVTNQTQWVYGAARSLWAGIGFRW